MGIVQRWAGATFTFTVPPARETGVVTGPSNAAASGHDEAGAFVLVADRAAWLVPVPDPRGRAAVEAASGGGES